MAKKTIILIIFLIVTVAVLLFLAFLNKKPLQNTASFPTPIAVTPNTSIKRVTKMSIIVPGKTSLVSVEKALGEPESTTRSGEFTTLNYPTLLNNFSDEVVAKNNVVFYSVENVFDDTVYGTTQNFLTKLGPLYVKLLSKGDYYWNVYLNSGVGIETNGTEILKIIRFIPQDKSSFLRLVAGDLGLTENQVILNEETIPAP